MPRPGENASARAGFDDISRLHSRGELVAAVGAAQVRLRGGGLELLPAPEPAELKSLDAVATVAVRLAADGSSRQLTGSGEGWAVQGQAHVGHEVDTDPELHAVLSGAGFRGAQRLSAAELAPSQLLAG
ncbi:MAG: hypothetical protein ABI181_01750 [Mycobacteriaceae bacterium]